MFNLPIGFGVVVSLRERDWTNSLREEEGDAKDFPAFLGFLRQVGTETLFWFSVCVCVVVPPLRAAIAGSG